MTRRSIPSGCIELRRNREAAQRTELVVDIESLKQADISRGDFVQVTARLTDCNGLSALFRSPDIANDAAAY